MGDLYMGLKVLVVIPAYNEALNIEKTVQDIHQNAPDVDYVVVNDGSKDNTLEVIQKNNFNHIDGFCNLGLFGAVQTGFKLAMKEDYDVVIQFDGDGQHDEKYIENLVEEIKKGANFVIGSRFIESLSKFKSSGTRRLGIKVLSNLIKVCTGEKIYDPTSGFRAADKEVIKLFVNHYPMEYPEPESTTELIKKGLKVKEIPVEMHERKYGKSSIKPLKSIYYMFSVCLSIMIVSINAGGRK